MEDVQFTRFYVEEEELYIKIGNNEFVFNEHASLFLLTACLGYKIGGVRTPLKNRNEYVLSQSFFRAPHAQEIYDAFKQIAIKNNEVNEEGLLKVNTLIEEYAKIGIAKIREILVNPTKKNEELINYILLEFDSELD